MRLKAFIIGMIVTSFLSINVFAEDNLPEAAYNGNIELVKKLLQKGCNPNKRDSFGGTSLHGAMFQKNTQIINLLIENGADVNAKGTSNGYTPLHDAVWANNLEAVKILMAHGAKTDIKANDGLTPYQKAVKEGKTEIAGYIKSEKSS